MMMLSYIKQHLSNIWSSIYEKVKSVTYKKACKWHFEVFHYKGYVQSDIKDTRTTSTDWGVAIQDPVKHLKRSSFAKVAYDLKPPTTSTKIHYHRETFTECLCIFTDFTCRTSIPSTMDFSKLLSILNVKILQIAHQRGS